MPKITLKKIKPVDKNYFAKWWRDKTLLKLTSGILKPISDKKITKYFLAILQSKNDYHFLICADKKIIGHISLVKRKDNWHETQIIIGEKKYWNNGYGAKAIKILINKAKRLNISKIFLEVRPTNLRAIKAYEKCGFIKSGVKKYPKNKFLPEVLRMKLNNTLLKTK
ncbi:GNAT family N-acetyltransferase [Candidatus Peregrinibacteria bacterium]|nr:GNAT family N-acetyltransferase [Candidatus Peregrinibacteria bacterium]